MVGHEVGRHKSNEWEEDIKIAKELLYPDSVIKALEKESNSIRRSNILKDARIAESEKW